MNESKIIYPSYIDCGHRINVEYIESNISSIRKVFIMCGIAVVRNYQKRTIRTMLVILGLGYNVMIDYVIEREVTL